MTINSLIISCTLLFLGHGSYLIGGDRIPVIVSHGFGANGLRPRLFYTAGNEELLAYLCNTSAENFKQRRYLFDEKDHDVTSFDYDDVLINMGIYGSIPNPFSSHIAQKNDMKRLKEFLEKTSSNKVIGFGHSRGAATWITMLGDTKYQGKISLLILEAPFATMKSTAFFRWIGQFLRLVHRVIKGIDINAWCEWLFNCVFGSYRFDDIEPILVAKDIDLSIPILIVHTKNDAIIPVNDSRDLYLELKKSGHDVYLLEPEEGDHSALLTANGCDEYVYLVHELFKQYDLPYKAEYVGKVGDLKNYQPTEQEIQERKMTDEECFTDDFIQLQEDQTPWYFDGSITF